MVTFKPVRRLFAFRQPLLSSSHGPQGALWPLAADSCARHLRPHADLGATMSDTTPPMDDFSVREFTSNGISHRVYRKGAGPDVLLMHELPGMTPRFINLARTVADAGFTVHLPLFFGEPGEEHTVLSLARLCISREFRLFARGGGSPIVDWLRAYGRNIFAKNGGRAIGVVGLCLTGNFAIALLADAFTLAPVAGEPSLPFAITAAGRASIAVTDEDLARAQARNKAGVRLLCLRFSNDCISPRERFAAIEASFPANFEGIVIPSPDARWGIPTNAHAVLTEHFSDADGHPTRHARDRVIAFLKERLG
jgi:dienelactone hydrolase